MNKQVQNWATSPTNRAPQVQNSILSSKFNISKLGVFSNLKLILVIVTLFLLATETKAQSNPCAPCPTCMTVYLTNNTGCPFDYYWFYNGPNCNGGQYYAGTVSPGASMVPYYPPCRSFCDGPCTCATGIELLQPGTLNNFTSVGSFGSLASGTVVWTGYTTCTACSSGIVKLTITYAPGINPNSCTFTLDCQ